MSQPSPQDIDKELAAALAELAGMPGFPRSLFPDGTPSSGGEPEAESERGVVVTAVGRVAGDEEIESAPHQRVLLVDDDDDYREMLRSLLVGRGYEVSLAADGTSGMAAALEVR